MQGSTVGVLPNREGGVKKDEYVAYSILGEGGCVYSKGGGGLKWMSMGDFACPKWGEGVKKD